MGWTGYHAGYYKNGKIDRKAECDDVFTWENGSKKVSVVKSAMVGTVYYAAVRILDEENGQNDVFGAVALTSVDNSDYFNFKYKDMDETVGPGYYDCPKGILDLLTPTDSEWANEWRAKCREKLASKKEKKTVPVGTVIEFKWGDKTVRAVRHAPAYQFKRPFWMNVDKFAYIPHTQIPENYTVVA